MENASTKERALAAALELFGRKGYDGVSMNDIAEAVGIRAPSLYKHFAGKEALFAAVAPAAQEHYKALWRGVAAGQSQLERDVRVLGALGVERLEQETLAWVQAELEQGKGFRAFVQSAGAGEGPRWLWDEPLGIYEGFFSRLIEGQTLKRGDAHVMAVEYLAPIFQMISLADADPDRARRVTEEVRRHIRQFHRAFTPRERPAAANPARGLFRR